MVYSASEICIEKAQFDQGRFRDADILIFEKCSALLCLPV
jgi:hypothetical protein